jgi:2-polyprenyl-3-methyl-5-hydroxy-6-metoxy-1,4-benzoquinol methylase
MATLSCPVCTGSQSRVLYPATVGRDRSTSSGYYVPTYNLARLHGEISRCASCGFVFVSDRLAEQELSRAYADMEDPAYLREAEAYRRASDWILSRLAPFKREGSRLLDIGCGAGFLLERARAAAWDARGIELSRWMVDRARERVPADVVRQGGYDGAHFRDIAFDVVVAVDVIEHVPDPAHFVADIAARLGPGGIALLVTPDVGSLVARALRERWWYIQVPHLNYFDRTTLPRLLARHGLGTLWKGGYPRFLTAEMIQSRLAYLPSALRSVARFGFRPFVALDRPLRLDLGDQLAVICRKG